MNEKTLNYNGYDLYYYTNDLNKKETIIFLHPAFSDHSTFIDQFHSLSDQYNMIALDMIGHGKSQPIKTSDDIETTLQHVKDIINENNLGVCHIVGVSLGSLVAQGFASKYPELTKTVTVVGGYSIHNYNEKILKAQQKEIFRVIFKIMFNRKGFRHYIAQVSTYKKHAYDRFYESSKHFKRKSLKYMQGMQKILVNSDKSVGYPLRLIYGDQDLEITLNHAKLWNEQIPESKLHIIKDAGHCVNMEQPEAFNEVLMQFLESYS
ncbi:alpha/beta fold hydrolase [Chengkuizengella sediminis]|uniref:alpha/beta fold hydrolase n=1 Tax=Chengkuizengella sediminis TaxID=1885917 RepID=UPI00138A6973|nr:alpha/beta hydrolase [Chengkuizengella sediminis]NDI36548.1 alpha/beta hydrolase [Chengkuizengella sediminis]